MVIFPFMGKFLVPISKTTGKRRHRRTEKVGIGGGGWVSGAESAAVGSGSVFVHVLVEQQAHFLPVALHGALRDSAQLGDFGE